VKDLLRLLETIIQAYRIVLMKVSKCALLRNSKMD